MNKRTKRRVKIGVGLFFGLLAITLVLVGLGFKQLMVYEAGLDYSMITGQLNSQTVYSAGIYYLSLSHRFLKFNKTYQTQYFQNVTALTSDQIVTTLNVQVQYQLTSLSASDLINYYIMFGENPAAILRPVFSNAIQKSMSTYTLSMLRTLDDLYLSNLVKVNIDTTLIPLVSMATSVSIDSITSNYQNKTASEQIAYLKRKNLNLANQISTMKNDSSDYQYRVQAAVTQANTSSTKRRAVELAQVQRVIGYLTMTATANVGTIRLFTQFISKNQSYFQDLVGAGVRASIVP